VLALLAFAALPALAQAEDSSGIQYETEHYESGAKPKKHSSPEGQKEPGATASNKPGGKHEGSQPPESNSNESEESKSGATPGNGGGNGGNGSSHQGNAPKNGGNSGGNSGGEAGLGEEKPVGGGTESGKPVSHSSGGSSPLVPILIAIAVLAAISIGAVIYRQRRQDSGGSGSPVSPKAG
jgi:hypothetical protein